MLCNSFIIAGLLDLSGFPGFVRSRPSLSSRVFRRDPIYNDLVLFQIIQWRRWSPHHLKASGMIRTHYLLLKQY